jgi:hypothetical protein
MPIFWCSVGRLPKPTCSVTVTPPSVHQMLVTLERVGLIRRQPGVAPSIQLLVNPDVLPPLQPPQNQPVRTSVQGYYCSADSARQRNQLTARIRINDNPSIAKETPM